MRVTRKPIFQTAVGNGMWVMEMVNRLIVAKALGFSAFEIDVTPVMERIERNDQLHVLTNIFGHAIAVQLTEGEEWKGDAQRGELRSSCVLTIYALVVE